VNKTKTKTEAVAWNEEINVIGIMKSINPISNCNRDFSVSIAYTIIANEIRATVEPRIILLNFN
jgi:hypothetical protein